MDEFEGRILVDDDTRVAPRALSPIVLSYLGSELSVSDEASLVALLADAGEVTLTFAQPTDVIWNGIHFRIPAGTQTLPQPIARIYEESLVARAQAFDPGAERRDRAAVAARRAQERLQARFAQNGVRIS